MSPRTDRFGIPYASDPTLNDTAAVDLIADILRRQAQSYDGDAYRVVEEISVLLAERAGRDLSPHYAVQHGHGAKAKFLAADRATWVPDAEDAGRFPLSEANALASAHDAWVDPEPDESPND